jgi:2-polyprenyl-6-methoxyphenol hydroxylase-like FAD-dependent oxidoreductase
VTENPRALTTRCCIAGGGPAGMMLGFLLARAGVEVVVLEKHADFLRDFRGDTIHPSTLEVMYELGVLDAFLKLPHQQIREIGGLIGDTMLMVADFTHLPTHCKFLAFMPQWDFLNFLAERGRRYRTFQLKMEANVTDLIVEGDRVAGVLASTHDGSLEVRAELIVAADGRHSTVRERSGLEVMQFGAPMDVLWLRLSRRPGDPGQTLGRADYGKIMVLLDRGDYWQCGFVIAKGAFRDIQGRGLEAFRNDIALLAPFMRDRLTELRDWSDVSLLTVQVDRLRQWHRSGLLCIGDAAHAMSPVGGVGINLAIQDAVAAANILVPRLRQSTDLTRYLGEVQRRREWPTRLTQRGQVFIQDRLIARVLESNKRLSPPWPLRMLGRSALLRRLPARVVGMGVRPEHVHTCEAREAVAA